MAGPSWLTVKEASDRAGVSDQYIRRLLSNGRLNGRQMGWQWLVDPESLARYLEERTQKERRQEQNE